MSDQRAPGEVFEPLTDEQVDMLLLGTDEVVYEMSRPTMVNALVLLAREVKQRRAADAASEIPRHTEGA